MLRLFYSRFNTLESNGYCGSVMEWVDYAYNSHIGKALSCSYLYILLSSLKYIDLYFLYQNT